MQTVLSKTYIYTNPVKLRGKKNLFFVLMSLYKNFSRLLYFSLVPFSFLFFSYFSGFLHSKQQAGVEQIT